jgi:hypothetical protein
MAVPRKRVAQREVMRTSASVIATSTLSAAKPLTLSPRVSGYIGMYAAEGTVAFDCFEYAGSDAG